MGNPYKVGDKVILTENYSGQKKGYKFTIKYVSGVFIYGNGVNGMLSKRCSLVIEVKEEVIKAPAEKSGDGWGDW